MDVRFDAAGYIEVSYRHFPKHDGCHEFGILEITSDKGRIQFFSTNRGAGFTMEGLQAVAEAFKAAIIPAPPIDDEIPF